MKFHLSLIFTLLLSLAPTQAIAADEIVEKTECMQAFGYADLDELKADLLLRAKRLAVDDLFGFLIVSSTAVQQSVLTNDEISTSSVGYVRVKGIPDYIHGNSLAEVCVTIQAYVTEKDRMKFEPITIAADECVTQPDLSPRKLEDLGEEQTIIKALVKMNAKLQDLDRASLLKLVRNVKFLDDSRIIPNTDTYCGNATVEVVPIEVEAFLATASSIPTTSKSTPAESESNEVSNPALLTKGEWQGSYTQGSSYPMILFVEKINSQNFFGRIRLPKTSSDSIMSMEGKTLSGVDGLASQNQWNYVPSYDPDSDQTLLAFNYVTQLQGGDIIMSAVFLATLDKDGEEINGAWFYSASSLKPEGYFTLVRQ